MTSKRTDPVYLDHAATTPMRPEAIAAMAEELGHLGNPSSLHSAGRRARRVGEESREQLAEVFGARPSEVVFTSGGTQGGNRPGRGRGRAAQDAAPPGQIRRPVRAPPAGNHPSLKPARGRGER